MLTRPSTIPFAAVRQRMDARGSRHFLEDAGDNASHSAPMRKTTTDGGRDTVFFLSRAKHSVQTCAVTRRHGRGRAAACPRRNRPDNCGSGRGAQLRASAVAAHADLGSSNPPLHRAGTESAGASAVARLRTSCRHGGYLVHNSGFSPDSFGRRAARSAARGLRAVPFFSSSKAICRSVSQWSGSRYSALR